MSQKPRCVIIICLSPSLSCFPIIWFTHIYLTHGLKWIILSYTKSAEQCRELFLIWVICLLVHLSGRLWLVVSVAQLGVEIIFRPWPFSLFIPKKREKKVNIENENAWIKCLAQGGLSSKKRQAISTLFLCTWIVGQRWWLRFSVEVVVIALYLDD